MAGNRLPEPSKSIPEAPKCHTDAEMSFIVSNLIASGFQKASKHPPGHQKNPNIAPTSSPPPLKTSISLSKTSLFIVSRFPIQTPKKAATGHPKAPKWSPKLMILLLKTISGDIAFIHELSHDFNASGACGTLVSHDFDAESD